MGTEREGLAPTALAARRPPASEHRARGACCARPVSGSGCAPCSGDSRAGGDPGCPWRCRGWCHSHSAHGSAGKQAPELQAPEPQTPRVRVSLAVRGAVGVEVVMVPEEDQGHMGGGGVAAGTEMENEEQEGRERGAE